MAVVVQRFLKGHQKKILVALPFSPQRMSGSVWRLSGAVNGWHATWVVIIRVEPQHRPDRHQRGTPITSRADDDLVGFDSLIFPAQWNFVERHNTKSALTKAVRTRRRTQADKPPFLLLLKPLVFESRRNHQKLLCPLRTTRLVGLERPFHSLPKVCGCRVR